MAARASTILTLILTTAVAAVSACDDTRTCQDVGCGLTPTYTMHIESSEPELELGVWRVDLELDDASNSVVITGTARTDARTGVEMEALTAVSIAALAVYDTCKSVSKGIAIGEVVLLRKEGGRSGTWEREVD